MNGQELDPKEERMISKLIHSSGRGPMPPPGTRERVYASVRAEWERNVAVPAADKRPGRSVDWLADWLSGYLRPALAVAATVAVALGVTFFMQPPAEVNLVQMAAVTKTAGRVSVVAVGGSDTSTTAATGMALYAGQRISTGPDGGVGLEFSSGESLRLDANTVVLLAAGSLELQAGAVYVDSETSVGSAAAVRIDSRFGSVRHIGTQYEARLQNAALRVRVREGTVAIDAEPGQVLGQAGEELVVPLSGDVGRAQIAANHPDWQWTEALAVLPDAAEYDVAGLLAWIARQSGRELRFASEASRQAADGLVLHGLGGLTPEEAIDVIRNTSMLQLSVTAESVVIE